MAAQAVKAQCRSSSTSWQGHNSHPAAQAGKNTMAIQQRTL
jgi:hypothetical protein